MTYDQILDHYGGLAEAALALEYTKQRIQHWRRIRIPSDVQLEISARTRGRLKADREAIAEGKRIAAYMERVNGG
jgi:hypothetical protein